MASSIVLIRRVEVLKPKVSSEGAAPTDADEATKVSGYIESPIAKMCGTCEYLQGRDLCSNKVVMADPQVRSADEHGLKIIDPVLGCCNEWESAYDVKDEPETD